jgi:hypothetical protein
MSRVLASVEETLAVHAVVDWILNQAKDPETPATREWIVEQLEGLVHKLSGDEDEYRVPARGDLYQSTRFDNLHRRYIVVGIDHNRNIPTGSSGPAVCLMDLVDSSRHWVSMFVVRWAFEWVG